MMVCVRRRNVSIVVVVDAGKKAKVNKDKTSIVVPYMALYTVECSHANSIVACRATGRPVGKAQSKCRTEMFKALHTWHLI